MPKFSEEIANKVFTRAYRGYDEREVDAFLDELMATIERYETQIETMQSAPAGERIPRAESEPLPESGPDRQLSQARALLNGVIDEAERVLDNAAAEAERIVESANAEAAQIIQAARAATSHVADEALEEATGILEEAKQEAARIVEAANEAAAERMRQADREAENLIADATNSPKPRIGFELRPDELYTVPTIEAREGIPAVELAQASAAKETGVLSELERKLEELAKRLESIETVKTTKPAEQAAQPAQATAAKPAAQPTAPAAAPAVHLASANAATGSEANKQREPAAHTREDEGDFPARPKQATPQKAVAEGGNAPIPAFLREELHTPGKAPWSNWLPNNTGDEAEDDAATDFVRPRPQGEIRRDPLPRSAEAQSGANDWNTID